MKTRDIDTALRALDPADRHIDPTGPRARTDLHAILATDPAPVASPEAAASHTGTSSHRVRTVRRVVLIGGLAAAAVTAAVVLPHLADREPVMPDQGPVTVQESAFWDAYGSPALEVDPPQSLDDLVDKAEVIVVGPIEEVAAGPERIDRLPEGDIVNESTVLTVRVDRTLKGQAGETIRVWMSGPAQGPTATKILGTESTTWFLEPSDVEGLDIMVSQLGVVGPNDQGRVVTLRSPEETPVIVDQAVASDPERFIDKVAALANP
jgi:hypothetical protein